MSAIRVALVGPSFPPQVGGVELHLQRLANELARLGCEVEVLVQWRHDDVEVESLQLLESGVIVRWFPSRTHSHRFPVAPSLVRHLIRNANRFDVIHGHSFHAVPGPLAALLTDRPFVFTPHYHGGGHTGAARTLHRVYAPIARRCFERAATVICNSRHERDSVAAEFSVGPDRLRVVYPGIDIDEIVAAEAYDVDVPVVLMAGRIESYKQIELGVRAIGASRDASRLVVLGDGPDLGRLRALAEERGAHERVVFRGRVSTEEVRRWQTTASVVLSLSRHEAFGLALLEGVAAGARAVASDIPAHREVASLTPASTRFVDVDATPEEVAVAIAGQLERPRPHRGGDGYPTWRGLAEGCLGVYEDALSRSVPTGDRAA